MRKSGLYLAVIAVAAMATAACSGASSGDGGSTGSSLNISGTLSTGTVSSNSKDQPIAFSMLGVQTSGENSALDFASYGVRCVTLASTPVAGEGSCDTDGKFSLSMSGVGDSPIGCFVISGAGNSASIVATLAFQGSGEDMSGSTSKSGSYVPGSSSSGLTMGTVTLDLSKGLAVVPTSQITNTGSTGNSSSGTFTDMTGSWKIHALATVPTGYITAGTSDDGPSDGMDIYLGHYSATDTNSATQYGLSIWESQSALTTCNGEGADLPSGWAVSPNTSPNNLLTTATNISTAFPAPSAVHISCWGGNPFAGLPTASCSGATSGNDWTATATCADIMGSPYASDNNTWEATTSCEAGSGCGDTNVHWGMTPVQAAFQCVLNNIRNASGSSCTGKVDVNWAGLWGDGSGSPFSGIDWGGSAWSGLTANTTDPHVTTYLNGAVRFDKRPEKRFMFGPLNIVGASGSLTDSSHYTGNACTSYGTKGECSGTQVECHISEVNKMTITQKSSTEAIVELVQISRVSPLDAAVCSTDTYVSKNLGERKWMFSITKN